MEYVWRQTLNYEQWTPRTKLDRAMETLVFFLHRVCCCATDDERTRGEHTPHVDRMAALVRLRRAERLVLQPACEYTFCAPSVTGQLSPRLQGIADVVLKPDPAAANQHTVIFELKMTREVDHTHAEQVAAYTAMHLAGDCGYDHATVPVEDSTGHGGTDYGYAVNAIPPSAERVRAYLIYPALGRMYRVRLRSAPGDYLHRLAARKVQGPPPAAEELAGKPRNGHGFSRAAPGFTSAGSLEAAEVLPS